MNNAAVVALFGHIALYGTPHRPAPETLQSLWKPKGKKRRAFYQCSEFKECHYATYASRSWTDQ